ncbi:hypothetical protein KBI51_05435 [Aerococcaceae bacterium zg-ZUI334]|uniref:hypothetical protein n=1 Tax=Aerococcaceae bacterium zg-252 TaxID=2796928 RepID=UPI001B9F400F|nr:hypothetical protein [Aerococcaceae bacterium zg-ZUI334]
MKKSVLSLVLVLLLSLGIVPMVQAEESVEDFYDTYTYKGESKVRGIRLDKEYIEIVLDMAQTDGVNDEYSSFLQTIASRFMRGDVFGVIDTKGNQAKDKVDEEIWRMTFSHSQIGGYPYISLSSAFPRYDLVDGQLFVSVRGVQLFKLQIADEQNVVDKFGNEFERLTEERAQ